MRPTGFTYSLQSPTSRCSSHYWEKQCLCCDDGISLLPNAWSKHAKLQLTPTSLSPVTDASSGMLHVTYSMGYLIRFAQVFNPRSSATSWTITILSSETLERLSLSQSQITRTLYHIFDFSRTLNLKRAYLRRHSTRCRTLVTSQSILVQIDENVSLMVGYGPLDFVVHPNHIQPIWDIATLIMLDRQERVTKALGPDTMTSMTTSDLVGDDLLSVVTSTLLMRMISDTIRG